MKLEINIFQNKKGRPKLVSQYNFSDTKKMLRTLRHTDDIKILKRRAY